MPLGDCVRIVAPYYNLALVLVVIYFFIKLFLTRTTAFLKPWKLLFAAVMVYVVEQVLTVLKFAELISYPIIVNSFMEMAIITLFIYMLLSQSYYLKNKGKQDKELESRVNQISKRLGKKRSSKKRAVKAHKPKRSRPKRPKSGKAKKRK